MNNIITLNQQEVGSVSGGLPLRYLSKISGAMLAVKYVIPFIQKGVGYFPTNPYTSLAFLSLECATVLFGADIGEKVGQAIAGSMPTFIRKHLN